MWKSFVCDSTIKARPYRNKLHVNSDLCLSGSYPGANACFFHQITRTQIKVTGCYFLFLSVHCCLHARHLQHCFFSTYSTLLQRGHVWYASLKFFRKKGIRQQHRTSLKHTHTHTCTVSVGCCHSTIFLCFFFILWFGVFIIS